MNLAIRKLERGDLENGFLKSLDSLRQATGINKEKADEVFEHIESNPHHMVLVAVSDDRVVGTCTLLMENKFIHKGSKICHIEDLSVDAEYQGTGVGRSLIKAALDASAKDGCYKTLLDCQKNVAEFYEKIGFKKSAIMMRFDH
ncbi:MAG: acetyltransferase GNAT family [Cenarchaeum symbiont of Oopsacas minuta]|nr:acetyltransferase GNAT family [Cenarchaeum symbiont of Oopsacas minuta]